jgi:integration host factor subunit alpha
MARPDTPPERGLMPTLVTPTLTKAELAELLFERLGLNKRESKDMVGPLRPDLRDAAVRRRRQMSGFGNFNIGAAPRPGATRAPARRSRSRARHVVTFTQATN